MLKFRSATWSISRPLQSATYATSKWHTPWWFWELLGKIENKAMNLNSASQLESGFKFVLLLNKQYMVWPQNKSAIHGFINLLSNGVTASATYMYTWNTNYACVFKLHFSRGTKGGLQAIVLTFHCKCIYITNQLVKLHRPTLSYLACMYVMDYIYTNHSHMLLRLSSMCCKTKYSTIYGIHFTLVWIVTCKFIIYTHRKL